MKIGVLICGYDCEKEIVSVLTPWQTARVSKMGGHDFILSMVHGQFTECASDNIVIPNWAPKARLDYITSPTEPGSEAFMRNLALRPLLEQNCDYIWLVDADEYYTVSDIHEIMNFVVLSKWESWFRLSFKNYVFTRSQYLSTAFTPPRIFKNKTNGYQIKEFHYDNDIVYRGTIVDGNAFVNKEVNYTDLPSKTIPKNIAWVRHESWLNNERSKAKVAYQEKHFAHGAGCSFAWDDVMGLVWNDNYFNKTGQPIPTLKND